MITIPRLQENMMRWNLTLVSDREVRALNVGSCGYVVRMLTYRRPDGSLIRQRKTGIRRLGTYEIDSGDLNIMESERVIS